MLRVGVGQIVNSTCVERNLAAVVRLLERLEGERVDVVLFPEGCLSGFSAKVGDVSEERLSGALAVVKAWSERTGVVVVLPTAIRENGMVYNAGYWIAGGLARRFYKMGLTESERGFFSGPRESCKKVFEVNGYRCGVLVCMEAQGEPWTYFGAGEVDLVLWPGYWGWRLEHGWAADLPDGKPNRVFQNMESWGVPLVQANFARNELGDTRGCGPEGLSVVVDRKNELLLRGPHLQEGAFVVSLEKKNGETRVTCCHLAQVASTEPSPLTQS